VATLLVIDNYDSFTYNLVQMFMPYDLSIHVHRSDRIMVSQACDLEPDYILISPGPKDPTHAGICVSLIQAVYRTVPILGVCLGMQCMNEAFGGATTRAPLPMHGKTSRIDHHGRGLFYRMPSPFTAARYHSLTAVVESEELMITSRSEDGVIMGLAHAVYPLFGVQFHPESFLTEKGEVMIDNFLNFGPLAGKVDHDAHG